MSWPLSEPAQAGRPGVRRRERQPFHNAPGQAHPSDHFIRLFAFLAFELVSGRKGALTVRPRQVDLSRPLEPPATASRSAGRSASWLASLVGEAEWS